MQDAVDNHGAAADVEQYTPIAHAQPIFRGELRQPLHVALQVLGQRRDALLMRAASFLGIASKSRCALSRISSSYFMS
jgi:hypothetical protein